MAVNKPYQLLHKSANSQQMYLNVLLKMPPPALYTLSGGLLTYRQDNNAAEISCSNIHLHAQRSLFHDNIRTLNLKQLLLSNNVPATLEARLGCDLNPDQPLPKAAPQSIKVYSHQCSFSRTVKLQPQSIILQKCFFGLCMNMERHI